MLQLKDVSFSYENGRELIYNDELSLGESIVLMGESGAGKTTLLNLIAGFLKPKSGSIHWQGQSWKDRDVRDRPVSYLMQNAEVIGHLSVQKNLSLSRANVHDIEDIAQKLGLKGLMDQKASELSGGQMQRVLLAQTLLQKRPLVLLDEPFKGLDSENRQRSLEVLKEWIDLKTQLLIVSTHDENDLMTLKVRKLLIYTEISV